MDNFTARGYEIIKELGANRGAGRVAYLAKQLDNNRLVVIKQFQFARSNSSWDGYKEIEREVTILKQLQHPNIPRYLATFETSEGSCLVQEYIDGRSLSEIISSQQLFTPKQVKDIIVRLLEILVYLQESFTEPILHRDLKPANILLDGDLQPFLIDFGGAKVSEGLGGSTVAVGTLGFMPPEQRFQQFNKTTDVYSLGLTIVCWLTRTEPMQMYTLINMGTNRVIGLRESLSTYSLRFVDWLEKVVQPDPNDRYPDAKAALAAFEPLYVKRVPEAIVSTFNLEFISNKLGERMTQTFKVHNNVPETVLEGYWEVASHLSDPPHTPNSHAWISFGARKFAGNDITVDVSIDTSKLKASTTYVRTILLHTNSNLAVQEIELTVRTAPIPQSLLVPYRRILFNIASPLVITVELAILNHLRLVIYADIYLQQIYHPVAIATGIVSVSIYPVFKTFTSERDDDNTSMSHYAKFVLVIMMLFVATCMVRSLVEIDITPQTIVSTVADAITAIIIVTANIFMYMKLRLNLRFKDRKIDAIAIATGCLYGLSIFSPLPVGSVVPLLLLESTPLAGVLIYRSVLIQKQIAQYRRLEQSSIDS
jgi:serine/threonine protein kinase